MQSKSHFLPVLPQNILRKKRKSDSNILPEAGGEQESETITIYNAVEQEDEKTWLDLRVQSSDLFLLAMGYLISTFSKKPKSCQGDIIIFQ